MDNSPFKRARAMFAAIQSVLTGFAGAHMPGALNSRQRAELAQIGDYKSRGKGRAGRQASQRTVAQDRRAAKKRRNQLRHRKAVKKAA